MHKEIVLSESCFQDLLKLIYELTGITISQKRITMVAGRLRKRVTALSLPGYEEYIRLVQDDRREQSFFIDLITTNETYFYRTPRIWDYIENKFLSEWYSKYGKQVLNIWSAAASSGEEAHTLGVLCQNFKDRNPSFLYQITGTDISAEMIGLCHRGRYTGRSIDSFKKQRPELFDKYMTKNEDNTFQVIPEIKSRLRFGQHNLFKSFSSPGKFDLVLIRNVLIYFKGNDQEKVLSLIAPKLSEEGVLIIGESESLTHIQTAFRHQEPLVYKLDSSAHVKPKVA